MSDIQARISMAAQKNYEEAIKKYGKSFADAVVAKELQLHADNLDCFDEYATYEWMQEFLQAEQQGGPE